MKLKSTLFTLFFFYLLFTNAQTKQFISASFDNNSNDTGNYICGGRTIIVTLSIYYTEKKGDFSLIYRKDTIFAENNKFYLEIAKQDSDSFVSVLAQNVDIGQPGKAVFKFPDSFKIGDQLKIRMVSTNPSLKSDLKEITFGVGAYPFIVDFSQAVNINKDAQQANLLLKSTLKNNDHNQTNVIHQNFTIKLNDGSVYENKFLSRYSPLEITVLPKDSISVYKVTEITNSCGIKGEIVGEAVVRKYDLLAPLVIKNETITCFNEHFIVDVLSKSIDKNTTYKIQFAEDDAFKNIIANINISLNAKNQFDIDLTKFASENKYYLLRVINEKTNIISNLSSVNVIAPTDIFSPYVYTFNADEIRISVEQKSSRFPNSGYYLPLNELIVNGVDLSKSKFYTGYSLNIPMPKKDTTLVFSKVTNTCGNLTITKPELIIKPDNYGFIKFATTTKSLCEGETIDYSYDILTQTNIDKVKFRFYFIISYQSNESTLLNSFYSNITANYTIDKTNKKISVTIPDNLGQQLADHFANKKVIIKDIKLDVFPTIPNQLISTHFVSPEIKLAPKLTLINPILETKSIGFVDIPVKYFGANNIAYQLTNGSSGEIKQNITNCQSECYSFNSGEQNLKIFIDKTITLKFISAKNQCGVATLSGETKVILNTPNSQSLVIDETKLSDKACRGTSIDIPFQQFGNWNSTPKLKLFTKYTDFNGNESFNQEDVDSSPYKFGVPYYYNYQKVELWIQSENLTKSNVITLFLETKPHYLSYSFSNNAVTDFSIKPETTYISDNNNNLYFRGYGANLTFKVDGKDYNNTYSSEDYSYLNNSFSINKDTTFILNSASNFCGTTEFNKEIKVIKTETIISNITETDKNYNYSGFDCSGAEHFISFNYVGQIPLKDSLTVQLAKYNNLTKIESSKLTFFDVPSIQKLGELSYTIPDTCYGSYVFRVRSLVGKHFSDYGLLSFVVKPKPIITLTSKSGKSEITGNQGAYLFLQGNIDKMDDLKVILNDGSNINLSEFGIYSNLEYDKDKNLIKVIYNNGKYFAPSQTNTYTIKTAYNSCGIGTAAGSVTIIINPSIIANIKNTTLSNTFCANDSLSLEMKYLGGFPKDTLMGIYLHTDSKASYNQELTTFKNNPSSIKIKLPNDIYSGYYFIQIRKKSRSKSYFAGKTIPDSLANANAKLNLDSEPVSLRIGTPPNINLSGNTEIFEGNSVILNIKPVNSSGQNIAISKDTINFIYGMPYYYILSDGSKLSSNNGIPIVSPLKTTTYSIDNIKNYCGTGTSTGNATITVLPKSQKRIETIGFYRIYKNYDNTFNFSYEYPSIFCGGQKDSLDIKVFGVEQNADFLKYNVALSDKDGFNFTPITTTKAKLIGDSVSYKIVRLFYELPINLPFGFNYQIKGLSDDASMPSSSLTRPIKIYQLPTASLTGNATLLTGEKTSALVKFTGDAPWLMSVIDKDNKLIYNGLPTKIDSTEDFKNYKPKLIYTNELKLELSPEKTNTYKVSKVYNQTCGFGKVNIGEFSVDLVVGNENYPQNLIQIYPNPTVNKLNIDLSSLNANTSIDLFDMSGRLITREIFDKSQTQQEQSLDFSHLNSGVYLLKVSSDKLLLTYKIVKH